MRIVLPLIALLSLLPLSGSATSSVDALHARLRETAGVGSGPCQDFFDHACARWTDPISAAAAISGPGVPQYWAYGDRGRELDRNAGRLLDSAQNGEMGPAGEEAAAFGERCRAVGDDDVRALRERLPPVDGSLTGDALWSTVGRMHALGLSPLWGVTVLPSIEDPERYGLRLSQGDLGLGLKGAYDGSLGARSGPTLRAYRAYVARQLRNTGVKRGGGRLARGVVEFEVALAELHGSPQDPRDPLEGARVLDVAALPQDAPGVAWGAWGRAANLPDLARIKAGPPDYLVGVSALVAQTDPAVLAAYLRRVWVDSMLPALPNEFHAPRVPLTSVLVGYGGMPDRWALCRRLTISFRSEVLWPRLHGEAVSAEARARAEQVTAAVRSALTGRIRAAFWLGPEARDWTARKTAAITLELAPPPEDEVPTYLPAATFFEEVLHARATDERTRLGRAGTPIDPSGAASPLSINAWYQPRRNEVTVAPGMVGRPWVDPALPMLATYAGLGAVVGHELGYAIDPSGRHVDASGRPGVFWADADEAAYDERLACYDEQLDGITVAPGVRTDGAAALEESLPDILGLQVAWDAWKASGADGQRFRIAGRPMDPDQQFFVAYAQQWCAWQPEMAATYTANGSHVLPNRARVNMAVRNHSAFVETFGCEYRNRMVLATTCELW